MRISNSIAQATIVAKQLNPKPSQNANGVVDSLAGQEKSPSRQKKTQNKNDSDKALIYAYNQGAKANPNGRLSANQRSAIQNNSSVTPSDVNAAGQQNRSSNIRGNVVQDGKNFGITKAINAYTNHQELDKSEHTSQLMGVDLYA